MQIIELIWEIYARIEQKKSPRVENFKSLVKSDSVAEKRTASYTKTHQGFLFMLNRTSKNSTDYRLIFASWICYPVALVNLRLLNSQEIVIVSGICRFLTRY